MLILAFFPLLNSGRKSPTRWSSPVFYMRGIKGQYIISIPQEKLVIVRIGTGRKPVYRFPEDKTADADYIAKNYNKVGHSLGLFEYISLGKRIAAQSKKE